MVEQLDKVDVTLVVVSGGRDVWDQENYGVLYHNTRVGLKDYWIAEMGLVVISDKLENYMVDALYQGGGVQ